MSWRTYARALQEAVLTVFAERGEDGEPDVSYVPEGGAPVPLRAVYRDPHFEELLLNSRRPSSTRTVYADFLISELPNYPQKKGDRIQVRRSLLADPQDSSQLTTFSIVDDQPDGEGLVRLFLQVGDS